MSRGGISGNLSGNISSTGGTKKQAVKKPVWGTASGSLGSKNGGTFFSFQLVATDPNIPPLPLTYRLVSGALPQSLALSLSGLISGTLPPVGTNTVSTFTIAASNGTYSINRTFSITDLTVALPTPSSVALTPSAVTIYDNTAVATQLATYAFTMTDGSTFNGPVTITSPASGFALSKATGNGAILTSQVLAAGSYTVDISGTQNGTPATGSLAVTVSASTLAPYISGSTYFGTPGDDTFTVLVAPWAVMSILGNGGSDTVIWPYTFASYLFFSNTDGSIEVDDVAQGTNQEISCLGITTFQFSDGFTIPVSQVPLSTPPGSIPFYPTSPVTAVSSHLTATVDFGNGTVWHFAEDSAVDMGDYVDPAGVFTQHSRLHAPAGIPMAVWFRPDASPATRDEVIFELGQQAFAQIADVIAYTATIKRSGSTLATVTVSVPANTDGITTTSAHYWGSRWRYQSAPRPVRKTPADLVAAKQMLHYDSALAKGVSPNPSTYTYAPMSFSAVGLVEAMATTGNRDDIGLVTETTAEWLCTAGSNALNNLRAQAESAASVPWHCRDETGAPVSIVRYPSANNDYRHPGDPWFPASNVLNATITSGGQTTTYTGPIISPDQAHTPSLTYIAFLITGDPYYLEELQFQANYTLLASIPQYRSYSAGLFYTGQTRGWAWNLRDAAQAGLVTPSSVPAWLLPKSYFTTIIENNRLFFDATFVSDPTGNPLIDVIHFCIDLSPNHIAPWQQDYLGLVLGWAVNAGYSWATEQAFQAGQAIGRSDNLTGYPRSGAVFYYYITDGVTSWPTLASVNSIVATMDGNLRPVADAAEMPPILRGALAVATLLGNANAAVAFAYIDGQVTLENYLPYKWAFRPSA